MSRSLKFRVWHKEKEYLRNGFDGCVFDGVSGQLYTPEYLNITDRYEVMQFTGQKDRCEKDIFEGDILDAQDGETPISVVYWCNDAGAWYQRYADKDIDMLCECGVYECDRDWETA